MGGDSHQCDPTAAVFAGSGSLCFFPNVTCCFWGVQVVKKAVLCLAIVAVIFCQGCCTIFTGDPQTISINSTPQGADVRMGPYSGVTPYQASVHRGKDYVIQATYAGRTETQNLEKQIQPLWFVNILFWPGLIVDLATGAMWEYDPTVYTFTFPQSQ